MRPTPNIVSAAQYSRVTGQKCGRTTSQHTEIKRHRGKQEQHEGEPDANRAIRDLPIQHLGGWGDDEAVTNVDLMDF